MSKNEVNKLVILIVRLRPHIVWDGDTPADPVIVEMHHKAHEECFIANSVRTTVLTEPVLNRESHGKDTEGLIDRV
jgi:organic hydroperoxide reductase OsmC/OhrA